MVLLTFLIVFDSVATGVYFMSVLVVGLYALSIIKGRMLHNLRKKFDCFIKNLDEPYFGARIANVFGTRGVIFYVLLPIVNPKISISVKVLPATATLTVRYSSVEN